MDIPLNCKLQLVREFSKVARYNSQIQKLTVYPQISSRKHVFLKTLTFRIATKHKIVRNKCSRQDQ